MAFFVLMCRKAINQSINQSTWVSHSVFDQPKGNILHYVIDFHIQTYQLHVLYCPVFINTIMNCQRKYIV